MNVIERILVPVDFSACSERAVAHAAYLAEKLRADLVLFHAWQPPPAARRGTAAAAVGMPSPALVEFAKTREGKEMGRLMGDLVARGLEGTRACIEEGGPCEAILRTAADGRYDLIVMGTHGRTGLSHLLMGSVAERVVRHANCPVLTVRDARAPSAEIRA